MDLLVQLDQCYLSDPEVQNFLYHLEGQVVLLDLLVPVVLVDQYHHLVPILLLHLVDPVVQWDLMVQQALSYLCRP